MNSIFYVSPLGQTELSELESLFTLVGDVKSIRVEALLQSVVGTRYVVIEMATAQQASDCIERYNGQNLLGQILSITASAPVLFEAKADIHKRQGRGKVK